MAAPSLNESELRFLRALLRRKVRFMVVELSAAVHGLGTFPDEWQHCIDVSLGRHKLKVLRMDRILASKRAANRPKDQWVVPVLEDSLAASNVAGRRAELKAASPRKRKPQR